MNRLMILALILISVASASAAQCGNPCSPVKWPLPTWPALASPTPLGYTSYSVPTPTPTGVWASPTPTEVYTATPTLTPYFDNEALDEQLATLGAIVDGTPIQFESSGTPVGIYEIVQTIAPETDIFFGYVKGINGNYLGPFAPLGTLFLLSVTAFFTLKATTFLLPLVGALLGALRKVVGLILDFLPF